MIEGKVIRLHAIEKRSYPSVTFSNWVPWLVTVGEEDRNKYTIRNTTNITITSQLSRNGTRAIVLVKSVQRSKNFVEKRTLNLMTARVLHTLKPLSNQPGVVAWVLTDFLRRFSSTYSFKTGAWRKASTSMTCGDMSAWHLSVWTCRMGVGFFATLHDDINVFVIA